MTRRSARSAGDGRVWPPFTNPVQFARKKVVMMEVRTNTFDGMMVSVMDNKLVMASVGGKERSYTVATDAKVTAYGKSCKTEDLKAGTKLRVTSKSSDRDLATRIETDGRGEARPRTRGGKVVRVTDNTLLMTNPAGMQSMHTLSAHTKVTSEGQARSASDLKPGMVVQVTSKPGDRAIVIGVEFAPGS
jgi:hypothetical protein